RIGSLLSNLSPSLVSGSEIVWRKEKSPNGKRSSVWDGRRQKNAAATAEYKGKTYYFCCNACKAKFQQAPEQYLKT
ncbi:MAG TPA: YHS domain-containing protein, partial [Candidatus Binatia bacterium]